MRRLFQLLPFWCIDIFFLLLLSLIPLLWFPNGYMVTSQDAAYPINIQENFQSRFFTWSGQEPFGRDHSYEMGSIMIHGVEALFSYVGLSHFDAQKMTFTFWFFVMASALYYFAYSLKTVFSYRFFPLVASVFYSVNYYLLALWRHGAGTTFAAYAALPLVASFYIRAITGELSTTAASICIGLTLFFLNAGGGLSVPLFGGLLIVLVVASIFYPFVSEFTERKRIFQRIAYLMLQTAIISFITNAYWIIPFLSFGIVTYHADVASQVVLSGARAWMDSVSGFTSITNLFRLQGFPDWYNNSMHSYAGVILQNPLFIVISFLFAPLAYSAMFRLKDRKQSVYILFFVIVSLVAIFFSAGTHGPTGYVVGWMVEHVPGFAIFRSSQYKFVPALYFSFAILISFVINDMLTSIQRTKWWIISSTRGLRLAIVIGVLGVIMLYHFPYFGREFFVWNKPLTLLLKIPTYALEFKSWSDAHLGYDQRLFVVPRLNSSWNTEVYIWNYFASFSLLNLITDKPIMENLAALDRTEAVFMDRVYSELLKGSSSSALSKLTALLQIPYTLVRGDSGYTIDWVPSEDPKIYKRALQDNHLVSRVWSEGLWDIYSLPLDKNYSSRLYSINTLTLFTGEKEDSIGPLLYDANNFVLESDIRSPYFSSTQGKLPVRGRIYATRCQSCILEKEPSSPDVFAARILPGSIFYPFKLWKERQSSDPSLPEQVLVGNKLGTSIKRLTEMMNLIVLKRFTPLIDLTGKQIIASWDYVDAFLQKRTNDEYKDFNLFSTMSRYVNYERSTLLKKYNDAETTGKYAWVKQTLGTLITRLDQSKKIIDSYLPANDWSTTKTYILPALDDSAVRLYLDTDALGDPITLPSRLFIGDKEFTVKPQIQGNRVELGSFETNGKTSVRLIFLKPADVSFNKRTMVDNYPLWGQRCIVSDVANYSWRKKYKAIFTTNGDIEMKPQAYVRKLKVSTEGIDTPSLSVKNPDILFNLESQNDQIQKIFYINSTDGDYGASVYFCVKNPYMPDQSLVSMTIEEVINPTLFVIPEIDQIVRAPIEPLSFERLNGTLYRFSEPASNSSHIIIFNERFNAGWRLYAYNQWANRNKPWKRDFWIDSPIFDSNHFRIFGYANAWYVDSSTKDGYALSYFPQQLYYRGIVVTIVGFVGIVVYMLIRTLHKRRQR